LRSSSCSELTPVALQLGLWALKTRFKIGFTSILSTFRAQPTTFMPCWTRTRATAAPMPTDAPVTNATLPFQRSIIIFIRHSVSQSLQRHSVTKSSNPRLNGTMYQIARGGYFVSVCVARAVILISLWFRRVSVSVCLGRELITSTLPLLAHTHGSNPSRTRD